MTALAHVHVGETVMSLQKTVLNPGGAECLVYTTLAGAIGVLVPFGTKEVRDVMLLISAEDDDCMIDCMMIA